MSEYGKLFEKLTPIRDSLKEISRAKMSFGELRATPLIDASSLAAAKKSIAVLKSDLDAYIAMWEEIEKEMKACDE